MIKAGLVRSHVECYQNQTQMTQIAESKQNINIIEHVCIFLNPWPILSSSHIGMVIYEIMNL